MNKLRIWQIDAFTGRLFGGNPAAVVPLDDWLDDATLQAIARENNLPETTFFVPIESGYHLRWFTPAVEVRLCGHATLASAFVLFTEIEPQLQSVSFDTLSGRLVVRRGDDGLGMDFPLWLLRPVERVPDALTAGLGVEPDELLMVDTGDNFFAVLDSESTVRTLDPDFRLLETLHPAGVIVTAEGVESDCVCRYFAPSYGIPEDSGTGSIHCALAPYWSARLGKQAIHSRQLSARGSELHCELAGERTIIRGQAVKYLEGWIRCQEPAP